MLITTSSPSSAPTLAGSTVATIQQRASLYVGDLQPETMEADLFDAFAKMGPVASVHLCRCALTGKSLCYAYVNFCHHADACKAMACLNHTDLKGKSMRIMWCQKDPTLRKCGAGNLFIKNLDLSVDGTCLLGLFCQFGTVLSCKVAEENGKSKGFGFVQFDSEESAMIARTALHDTFLRGKKLYVTKFVKKSDRTATTECLNFTNLYVKNLVEDMTEDLLLELFSKFGKVYNAAIMKDENGKSRGFGFVNFQTPEEARKAVEVMDGAQLGSKILFVGRAQKRAERTEILKHEYKDIYDSHIEKLKASNLYVKNLNVFVDEKKLQELFSGFGRITSARVMRQKNGRSKGFGFVCFSTPEEAKSAMNILNGSNFEGKTLYVAVAQTKEDRHKALQNCFVPSLVQSSYPSSCTAPYPRCPPYYFNYHPFPLMHQPISYQHYNTNVSFRYPLAIEKYQNNYSYYIPLREAHLENTRNTKNWAYQQQSVTYPSSDICTQDLVHRNHKGIKPGNGKESKRSAPLESSYQREAIRSHATAPTPEDRNNNTECTAKVTGMVLKVNNSEIIKLLSSPNSLAKPADNTVQVLKEVTTRASADGGIELPKSACCLSY